MGTNKIREYIMVKDKFSHAKLEEVGCYDYYGELKYTDHIYYMLTNSFKMDSLLTEVSYVIAFDHEKMPKGICKVGQGGLSETPTPMQPVFTFLLLAGARSFVVAHNHVSNMPNASESDKLISEMLNVFAEGFDIEFIGHMVINPNGYIIDGGIMDGTVGELDEDGEIVSWNAKEEIYEEEPYEEEGEFSEEAEQVEDMYEVAKELRKKAERR